MRFDARGGRKFAMLLAALRDLQWRRRRVAITLIGTALVFSMSLLMSGLAASFVKEVERTLDDQAVDTWLAPRGSVGPFTAGFGITDEMVVAARATSGVTAADPLLFGRTIAKLDKVVAITVFGVVKGGITGIPEPTAGGRDPVPGGVVVPKSLNRKVGETLQIAKREFTVVGVIAKASLFAGTATVFMTLDDARDLLIDGQPLSSLVLARGSSDSVWPPSLQAFDRSGAESDLLRPFVSANKSINFVKFLLWLVAALIVASVVFLTALERSRDFAVFKATGVSTGQIGAGICLQAVILAVGASLVGVALSLVLAPLFPMDVAVPVRSILALPLLAIVVGLVAGLVGVRRVASVQPATAFGGP
jgi:putative ABC transport system permease protein